MHSLLALTEHASLNLAPLILLDPVSFIKSLTPKVLNDISFLFIRDHNLSSRSKWPLRIALLLFSEWTKILFYSIFSISHFGSSAVSSSASFLFELWQLLTIMYFVTETTQPSTSPSIGSWAHWARRQTRGARSLTRHPRPPRHPTILRTLRNVSSCKLATFHMLG